MTTKYSEFLTADNSVLAMIDHQTGLMVGLGDEHPTVLKNNIVGLTRTAKAIGLPSVVTASLPEGPNGPVMPEITQVLGEEVIEREGQINAWDSLAFKQAIEKTGRKKIIMAGIVTDVCLLFPALSAVEEGYDVYAVIDASGTWNKTVQEVTIQRLTQAGVKVTTWASVLAELMNDWRSEHGEALGQVLAEHTTKYGYVMNSYFAKG
ncbi:isochorismatase family protein [Vibrio coralliilyticus]|uniref:isochorismatase family protein n=1 Tax=Vibrio coralliilyticus TaxID=190893 RepID=UPI000391526E|nr:isochorismatase family protein [Vibrio coralliilyticus]ERB65837.1 hydrolase [Vibrio coralliilyticus OCN008]NRF30260.1 isochorismatase family protein [Vibrio coralliilyticus]NRF52764.1 isochorismatase family protein [Vibrio coralliilyticus]NRG04372.1 isochorismatase family protein [Vibrio coralliilyticus]QIJ84619.1 isochorismatase family protein [Vibrio coralliilyticus OCN008]